MIVINYTMKVIDYNMCFCTKTIVVMDNMVHIIDYSITYFFSNHLYSIKWVP